jgi:hypothetical protein
MYSTGFIHNGCGKILKAVLVNEVSGPILEIWKLQKSFKWEMQYIWTN